MVKHEIKKITHYEYWSWWVYYFPLIPLYLWYSIKAKSLVYFTAVNPSLKYGGMFGYSKYKLQDKLPNAYRPNHQFISAENRHNVSIELDFPLVAKPDKGERGRDVQIIQNQKEASTYLNNHSEDLLLQELVDEKEEYGLFYIRYPNQEQGKILSITGKKFLTFEGDGKTSLRNFIESDSRAYFNKSYLYMKYHHKQELVLAKGEKMLLEPIGNHNRGTYFYDASNLATEKLVQKLDTLLSPIEGFYYGRLDVKTSDATALQNGDFTVLEINGANSEATHIFDKKYSLIDSYQEFTRHLKQQYLISRENLNQGFQPPKKREFLKDFYQYITNH